MSLQEFADKLNEIGGIKNTYIKDDKLFVKYFGSPNNYSTKRGSLRKEYPEIEQVGREEDASGHVTLIYQKV